MIFLETFVFKLTSHPKSASMTFTAMSDFFPKKIKFHICMYVMYLGGGGGKEPSAGKYCSQLYWPLLFVFYHYCVSRINYWRIHCWNFKIQPGLILLIIISSVQNYACEVDCTDHYHIAFEQNAMPALVRTFTISIPGDLPKSTNFF